MHGKVSEWVLDWHYNYTSNSVIDPVNDESTTSYLGLFEVVLLFKMIQAYVLPFALVMVQITALRLWASALL